MDIYFKFLCHSPFKICSFLAKTFPKNTKQKNKNQSALHFGDSFKTQPPPRKLVKVCRFLSPEWRSLEMKLLKPLSIEGSWGKQAKELVFYFFCFSSRLRLCRSTCLIESDKILKMSFVLSDHESKVVCAKGFDFALLQPARLVLFG